jgi:hypothetical protein
LPALGLFVPFNIKIEHVEGGVFCKSNLSNERRFRTSALLNKIAELDTSILRAMPRLGSLEQQTIQTLLCIPAKTLSEQLIQN